MHKDKKCFIVAEMPYVVVKSDSSDDEYVGIEIVAGDTNPDRVGDVIDSDFYSEERVRDFIASHPVIDFDHESIRGKSKLDQEDAKIGEITDFELRSGSPVFIGRISKKKALGRTILDNIAMIGEKCYKASVGIMNAVKETAVKGGKSVNKIVGGILNHIAITPSQMAINQGASIALVKSFDTFDDFKKYKEDKMIDTIDTFDDFLTKSKDAEKSKKMKAKDKEDELFEEDYDNDEETTEEKDDTETKSSVLEEYDEVFAKDLLSFVEEQVLKSIKPFTDKIASQEKEIAKLKSGIVEVHNKQAEAYNTMEEEFKSLKRQDVSTTEDTILPIERENTNVDWRNLESKSAKIGQLLNFKQFKGNNDLASIKAMFPNEFK